MAEFEEPNISTWKPSACILCECNCGIEVQLGGDGGRRLAKVRGDKAHPASQGYACEKPSRLDFYQNDPERLTTPLRRRADGSFEQIDWATAIREVAERLYAIRDEHGGESIFYYGGGGQGNHLPGAYSRSLRAALGSRYRSNALAQEKTGEAWVAMQMLGRFTRSDFEHCEVGVFLGKNPWFSHGIPRARVTLRELSRDPERCMIVIDPRRTETAELADIHLQVKPGGDAWLLAAMFAVIVQEDLLARDWLEAHCDGLDEVLPHFEMLPIGDYCARAGVPEELVRAASRRIASASSVAFFEDLGVQMNRHSTLVSYLHRLLAYGTGNYGREGSAYPVTSLQPLFSPSSIGKDYRTPVTNSRVIIGLTPCNVIPDEILTDHPKRFRAMFVEAANPVHSLADSRRMREAFEALDLVVVVDIALSETARMADYVLPVASQFEKAEATFFNFEFPHNYFHLRHALMDPPQGLFSEAELHARLAEAMGAMPKSAVDALRGAWDEGRAAFRAQFFELLSSDASFIGMAPVALYRAIGDKLPEGCAEAAALWALAQISAQTIPDSIRRAGIGTENGEDLGDALFDAMLANDHGFVFAIDAWDDNIGKIGTPNGRIQLALPELFAELDSLPTEERMPVDREFPLVLSAGERRAFTANTILRDPSWRRKDASGALRVSPEDAERLGLADGGRARLTTRRGSAEVVVEISNRMQAGHISLPNGTGIAHSNAKDIGGISPNELTATRDRDPIAGTPWHKSTAARVEAI
ncbi:MAG: molybdopterin-dependent oxidoreductase [Deltaproteobacteria bacterium]|jgi:anaerobic selenocysteine-containing dehydrogenase|nr:molybdopterin-dependent oxidoreductase [Deltaproteobacteria bacterium]